MTPALPTLKDEDVVAIEAKEVETALTKVNAGALLSKHERDLLKRAHERSKTEDKVEVTELGFSVSVVESMEAEGRWPDLSRLRARRPELLDVAVFLLGCKTPVRVVCEKLKLSPCTVQAIMDDPDLGKSVVSQKAEVMAQMKLAFRLSIEHQVELARQGKLGDLATKFLFDMIQLWDGGATSRTEHVVRVLSPAEQALDRLLDGMRGMGLDSGNVLAMGAGSLGDGIGANSGAVGSEAPALALSVRDLHASEARLLSNDPVPASGFSQGVEGGGDARPP